MRRDVHEAMIDAMAGLMLTKLSGWPARIAGADLALRRRAEAVLRELRTEIAEACTKLADEQVSRTHRTEHRRDRCGRCRQSRSRSSTLKAGSASVLLTSGCQGALSCATRQGGLLLDGADGDPDVVRHQGGGQDSDGGNQASDGLVGHDITLGCPLG